MGILPLLDDGSCSLQATCLKAPHDVHAQCPQTGKCGTCVAWSPREANGYGRSSGQCMLDRDARVYLDCNAPICPYYRPRAETMAYVAWRKAPSVEKREQRRTARRRLDREVPPPSAAALAMAAFAEHAPEVAEAGAPVLEATLEALGPVPVLLERFRGGTVRFTPPGGAARETTMEAFFARLALLARSLRSLEEALEASGLTADEKDKVLKDLAGIGGSLTTFNLLFKEREDAFRGQGKL